MACNACHSDCSQCEDYGLVLRTRRSPRALALQAGARPVSAAFAAVAVAVPAQGPATPLSPQAPPPAGSAP